MTAQIIRWLFGTAMGRGVLIGLSVTIGLVVGWYVFSSHYEKAGYDKCQIEHEKAQNSANVAQAEKNAESGRVGSAIAAEAAGQATEAVKAAERNTTSTKEGISNAYKDPPRTAPVSLGSCVHPVDDRVQELIDNAVREANASAGQL